MEGAKSDEYQVISRYRTDLERYLVPFLRSIAGKLRDREYLTNGQYKDIISDGKGNGPGQLISAVLTAIEIDPVNSFNEVVEVMKNNGTKIFTQFLEQTIEAGQKATGNSDKKRLSRSTPDRKDSFPSKNPSKRPHDYERKDCASAEKRMKVEETKRFRRQHSNPILSISHQSVTDYQLNGLGMDVFKYPCEEKGLSHCFDHSSICLQEDGITELRLLSKEQQKHASMHSAMNKYLRIETEDMRILFVEFGLSVRQLAQSTPGSNHVLKRILKLYCSDKAAQIETCHFDFDKLYDEFLNIVTFINYKLLKILMEECIKEGGYTKEEETKALTIASKYEAAIRNYSHKRAFLVNQDCQTESKTVMVVKMEDDFHELQLRHIGNLKKVLKSILRLQDNECLSKIMYCIEHLGLNVCVSVAMFCIGMLIGSYK